MNTPRLTLFAALVMLSSCTSNSHIYRDQPLVAQVETGMSKDQVERIGGKPLAVSNRTVVPGTCYDYMFTNAGHKQPFNVSFDYSGKVDHTSFITCAQWSRAQQKSREPSHKGSGVGGMGGMGGSGY
ncbi:osmotically-inducible lipoprotein OsmE [Pseudomonas defluvii]|uniref:osmotically-inducible lipoprotein OsmE n=1 Tax=Pseudomonas defluvii TaxID=1876757 RepID=UPI003906879D